MTQGKKDWFKRLRPVLPTAVLAIFVVTSGPLCAQAQFTEQELLSMAEEITLARAQNQQALREFSWNQRTELKKEGEVTSTRLELVRYGVNGQEQRTVLNESKPKEKKRIAGRIQAKKIAEMKEWGEAVKAMIMRYTLNDTESLANFLSKASYGLGQEAAVLSLNARNIVQQGDRMEVIVDRYNHQILSAEVYTSYEMDPLFLEIFHGRLPDGLSYIRNMELIAASKDLELLVENFNYIRN